MAAVVPPLAEQQQIVAEVSAPTKIEGKAADFCHAR
jgi:hypothetical protein